MRPKKIKEQRERGMKEVGETEGGKELLVALLIFVVTLAAALLAPPHKTSDKIVVKSVSLREFNDGTLITLIVSNPTGREIKMEGGKIFVRTRGGIVEGTLRAASIPPGGVGTIKVYVPGVGAGEITALNIAGKTVQVKEIFKKEGSKQEVSEEACVDECESVGTKCQAGKYFICEDVDFDGCLEKVSIDADKDKNACNCGGFFWNGRACCGDDKGEETPNQCKVGEYFDEKTCKCRDVWVEGWRYRRIVWVKGPLVRIILSKEGLEGKIKDDCSDILLTDTNGVKVPYWIEECDKNIVVWARPGDVNVLLLFYGNPTAILSQNGEKVFKVFDDFERLEGWKVEEGELCGDGIYDKEIRITTGGSGRALQITLKDNDGDCPARISLMRRMEGSCLIWVGASPSPGDAASGYAEEGIVGTHSSITIRQSPGGVVAVVRRAGKVKRISFECNPYAFNTYKICPGVVCCNGLCHSIDVPLPTDANIVLSVVNRGGFATTLLVDKLFSYGEIPAEYTIGEEKDVEHTR